MMCRPSNRQDRAPRLSQYSLRHGSLASSDRFLVTREFPSRSDSRHCSKEKERITLPVLHKALGVNFAPRLALHKILELLLVISAQLLTDSFISVRTTPPKLQNCYEVGRERVARATSPCNARPATARIRTDPTKRHTSIARTPARVSVGERCWVPAPL
jgi:hypothetical protein